MCEHGKLPAVVSLHYPASIHPGLHAEQTGISDLSIGTYVPTLDAISSRYFSTHRTKGRQMHGWGMYHQNSAVRLLFLGMRGERGGSMQCELRS